MTVSSSSLVSLGQVAAELDALACVVPAAHHHGGVAEGGRTEFPSACRAMLYSLPGNSLCVDCGCFNPRWASVTYGVLLCVQCSGRHRSYGVQTSFVRSIDMDSWSHRQVLSMLEGGNEQLRGFFERHRMDTNKDSENRMTSQRYRTKAALFYSTHLKRHVESVAVSGSYQGREAVRGQQRTTRNNQHQIHQTTSTTTTTQTTRTTIKSTTSTCSAEESAVSQHRHTLNHSRSPLHHQAALEVTNQ